MAGSRTSQKKLLLAGCAGNSPAEVTKDQFCRNRPVPAYGIGADDPKITQLQVLFELLEEYFDLPAALIKITSPG